MNVTIKIYGVVLIEPVIYKVNNDREKPLVDQGTCNHCVLLSSLMYHWSLYMYGYNKVAFKYLGSFCITGNWRWIDDTKEAFYASLVVQLKLPHYYQFMQSVSTNLTLQ